MDGEWPCVVTQVILCSCCSTCMLFEKCQPSYAYSHISNSLLEVRSKYSRTVLNCSIFTGTGFDKNRLRVLITAVSCLCLLAAGMSIRQVIATFHVWLVKQIVVVKK